VTLVPLSVIVCGLLLALVVTFRVPVCWSPVVVGLRVRPTVQLAPAASVLEHIVDG
jgi:hypothetical protein